MNQQLIYNEEIKSFDFQFIFFRFKAILGKHFSNRNGNAFFQAV